MKREFRLSPGPVEVPNPRKSRPSILTVVWLMALWVMIWGDLSWGNVVNGLLLGLLLSWLVPMPREEDERFVIRPIALLRLIAVFLKDIVVATIQISWFIIAGRKPQEAIIRVQTRAESDIFLTITSAFTALVPGSIVVEAHRLTGMMYVHIFDVSGEDGLRQAHQTVIRQEERILRALGTKQALIEAGYVPGGSMKLGRLPKAEFDEIKREKALAQQAEAAENQSANSQQSGGADEVNQ